MLSKGLKEKRADLELKIKTLNDKAEAESRELTVEELDSIDKDIEEVEKLNSEIAKAESREKVMAEAAARSVAAGVKTPGKEEKQAAEKYSFMEFVRQARGGKLEGLYKEMDAEARVEANKAGVSINHLGIPSFVLDGIAKRDITAGTPTAQGLVIGEEKRGIIEYLEAKTVLGQMGADFMGGLIGNISWPREDSSVAASWKSENATSAEVTPTVEEITMSPNRLTAFIDISNQLIKQTSPSIENRQRARLLNALARGIEIAAINGTGSNNQPLGLLGTSGIGSVSLGANGGDITWSAVVELWKECAIDNADIGNLAYLTTPQAIFKMRTILKSSGVSGYILPEGNTLNGYNVMSSNTVPSNLDKGGSSSTLSAMIFGNWNDLAIGMWGGLDILVDPYTQGKEGLTAVIATAYADVAVLRPQSFAAIQDITTS